jgi:hypothetical protein
MATSRRRQFELSQDQQPAAATRKRLRSGGNRKFGVQCHDWPNGSADCRLTPDPRRFISIPTAQHLFGPSSRSGGAGRDANEHRDSNSCPSLGLKCEDSMLSAGDLWPVKTCLRWSNTSAVVAGQGGVIHWAGRWGASKWPTKD